MAIEFQCRECHSLLRTPDETAGKQAKCPQCGALTTIPSSGEDRGEAASWQATASDAAASDAADRDDRFGPPPEQPYPWSEDVIPTDVPAREQLAGKVRVPAIGMMIGATLSLLNSLANLVLLGIMGLQVVQPRMPRGNQPLDPRAFQVGVVAVSAMTFVVCALVLLGSLSLFRMRSYAVALLGSTLALLPCGPCCVITLPFGIWALFLLSDSEIRSAFRS